MNLADSSGHELLKSQIGKDRYSLFNSLFVKEKYNLQAGTHAGMFGALAKRILREATPGQVEEWDSLLRPLLNETDQEIIQKEIRSVIKSQGV